MANLHVPIVAENVVQGARIVLVDLRTQKDSQPARVTIILFYFLFNIYTLLLITITTENTRMHEYIYLKTTKLYILLLHTGVNNVCQATLLFL